MGELTELPGRLLLNDMGRMFGRVIKGSAQFSDADPQQYELLRQEATLYQRLARTAQPFLVPANGDFGLDGTRTVMLGELRPPFPVTALEFHFQGEWADRKNFAAMTVFLMDEWNDGEFAVSMCAAYLEKSGTWGWCDEVLRVPKGETLTIEGFDSCTFASGALRQSLGIPKDDDKFRPVWAFVTRAAADFLCLLSCANVDMRDAPVSRVRRERDRDRTGGRFLVYKMLDIGMGTTVPAAEGSGTHASPRFHLRRGHIRRLATGKNVWVRATTVGKATNGVVAKDYRVGKTL